MDKPFLSCLEFYIIIHLHHVNVLDFVVFSKKKQNFSTNSHDLLPAINHIIQNAYATLTFKIAHATEFIVITKTG